MKESGEFPTSYYVTDQTLVPLTGGSVLVDTEKMEKNIERELPESPFETFKALMGLIWDLNIVIFGSYFITFCVFPGVVLVPSLL